VQHTHRLAPDVYLGVVRVTRRGIQVEAEGKCEVVEWAVKMRRLPDDGSKLRNLKMVRAVVFDLDGLMIDSQPFWQAAQLEVFPQVGASITRQDTIDTTGMRVNEMVQICYARSPWDSISRDEVCDRIVKRVTELVQQHKPAMPGLHHAIEICQQQGLKLAIASPLTLIQTAIEALKLEGVFSVKTSGESLRYAKPHPEVYLKPALPSKLNRKNVLLSRIHSSD
jgi:phosphoglycolate phosphatase-like HAD superfamily hydrolase